VPGAEQERRIRRLTREVGLQEDTRPVAPRVRRLDGEETVAQTLATAERVREERQRGEAEAARRRAQEEARAAAYRHEQTQLVAAQCGRPARQPSSRRREASAGCRPHKGRGDERTRRPRRPRRSRAAAHPR